MGKKHKTPGTTSHEKIPLATLAFNFETGESSYNEVGNLENTKTMVPVSILEAYGNNGTFKAQMTELSRILNAESISVCIGDMPQTVPLLIADELCLDNLPVIALQDYSVKQLSESTEDSIKEYVSTYISMTQRKPTSPIYSTADIAKTLNKTANPIMNKRRMFAEGQKEEFCEEVFKCACKIARTMDVCDQGLTTEQKEKICVELLKNRITAINREPETYQEIYKNKAKAEGGDWFIRNKKALESLERGNISHWSRHKDTENYRACRNQIEELFNKNETFRELITRTAGLSYGSTKREILLNCQDNKSLSEDDNETKKIIESVFADTEVKNFIFGMKLDILKEDIAICIMWAKEGINNIAYPFAKIDNNHLCGNRTGVTMGKTLAYALKLLNLNMNLINVDVRPTPENNKRNSTSPPEQRKDTTQNNESQTTKNNVQDVMAMVANQSLTIDGPVEITVKWNVFKFTLSKQDGEPQPGKENKNSAQPPHRYILTPTG